MRYFILLFLILTLGCSPNATYKPGNYVRDKCTGESYMILYSYHTTESDAYLIRYKCREMDKFGRTHDKLEVELEPYIPPEPKVEKDK